MMLMRCLLIINFLVIASCAAFTAVSPIALRLHSTARLSPTSSISSFPIILNAKPPAHHHCHDQPCNKHHHQQHQTNHPLVLSTTTTASSVAFGLCLACLCALAPLQVVAPARAYEQSDYASETVQQAVQSLLNAQGNAHDTFRAYEGVEQIITEGKGVGGSINYQGIQLDRGYIADEDTAIYNPGLTLLTESEKERLTEAVIEARRAGLKSQTWTENNEVAYDFLKTQLDPLHMTELKGYLKIFPIYGAILYLATLAVQQFARGIFPAAYLVALAAIFAPIAALLALGPQ